jgi:hypothetical protein
LVSFCSNPLQTFCLFRSLSNVTCAETGRKPHPNLPSFSLFPSVQILFKPSVISKPVERHLRGNWTQTPSKFTFVFFVSFCSNPLQTFGYFEACRTSPARETGRKPHPNLPSFSLFPSVQNPLQTFCNFVTFGS